MKVVSVLGPSESDRTALVERLVQRLQSRGSVATVTRQIHDSSVGTGNREIERHRAAGTTETVGIADDAGWVATGEQTTLRDALDGFAPRHDYAVVDGFSDARLPAVVLGGAGDEWRDAGDGHERPVLQRAPTADDTDVSDVLARIESLDPYVTLETLVDEVKASPQAARAGAIATFTGRVRERDGPGDPRTTHLEFERYDAVAAERLAAIRDDLEAREGVYEVRLHHRVGLVEAGEDIVYVVVLAGHRAEAFEAVADGIDRLKAEVPLFKREVTVEDAFWAHER